MKHSDKHKLISAYFLVMILTTCSQKRCLMQHGRSLPKKSKPYKTEMAVMFEGRNINNRVSHRNPTYARNLSGKTAHILSRLLFEPPGVVNTVSVKWHFDKSFSTIFMKKESIK